MDMTMSTPSPVRVWVLTSTPRGRVMATITQAMAARRRTHSTGRVFDTQSSASTKPRMLDIFRYGYNRLPRHHRYPASRGMSSRSQKNPLLTSSKLVSDMFLLLFTLLLLLRLRGVLRSLGGAQGFDESSVYWR